MIEFLVFTLCAPLASWGEIAVGEMRDSWDRPSRSVVLGFLAGALGLTRDDQNAHDDLSRGLGVAVRLDVAGVPLVDYHTAQTVAAQTIRRRGLVTRAEQMAVRERETILSRRSYRQGAVSTVAVWRRGECTYSLDEIAAAIRHPRFVPFAGRKANALGLPVVPVLLNVESLAEAFLQRERDTRDLPVELFRPRDGWGREVAHDPCESFGSGLKAPFRRETRRDDAPHRSRWQFAERIVDLGTLPSDGGPSGTPSPEGAE
ncbi:MAG TPA: type I-E CRISPR-associated protein Cas5/CasD [Vicinamibacterales bacterium]